MDVYGAGIADVGTIFLEGDAQHKDFGSFDGFFCLDHHFYDFVSDIIISSGFSGA